MPFFIQGLLMRYVYAFYHEAGLLCDKHTGIIYFFLSWASATSARVRQLSISSCCVNQCSQFGQMLGTTPPNGFGGQRLLQTHGVSL